MGDGVPVGGGRRGGRGARHRRAGGARGRRARAPAPRGRRFCETARRHLHLRAHLRAHRRLPRRPARRRIAAAARRGDGVAWGVDFEQASTGRFAYDLAVALLAWCWNGADLDEPRARALAESYRAARALDGAERAALYAEARFAALRFTVTRITDVFL